MYNDYFCRQADLNDPETAVPDITDILINGLEQIPITEKRVKKTNNAMVKKKPIQWSKRQTMQWSKRKTIQWSKRQTMQ